MKISSVNSCSIQRFQERTLMRWCILSCILYTVPVRSGWTAQKTGEKTSCQFCAEAAAFKYRHTSYDLKTKIHVWLVVSIPLKNMLVSQPTIRNIRENEKIKTINQLLNTMHLGVTWNNASSSASRSAPGFTGDLYVAMWAKSVHGCTEIRDEEIAFV